MSKEIRLADLLATISIIVLVYGFLIYQNSSGWHWDNVDSRFTLGTLQWRVDFWKKFLENIEGVGIIIGNGLGQADLLFGRQFAEGAFPPHNDYLRIYHDSGLLGLCLYLLLIVSILRKMIRDGDRDGDYILLSYLTVLLFFITDNFIYHTNTIIIYLFLACHIGNPFEKRQTIDELV